MTIALGLLARWAHLACGLGLLGVVGAMLLAGPSAGPTATRWMSLMSSLVRWLAGAVLLSGIATLAGQAAVVAGRPGAALDPAIWVRLLAQSQFGTVWLVRHGLLGLLAALAVLREREDSRLDWAAWRIESWLLAGAGMTAAAWAGHAAAVEPLGLLAALTDALHLVAAGAWLGALLPLAILLKHASTETGADARPYAVLAIRRFSRMALVAMLAVVATGLWNTWVQVGGIPALVGTPYGWLLLAKIALVAVVLGLAAHNRRRLLPALPGDAATVGRPAMARLSRFLGAELGLGLGILALTAGLSLTAPALHDSPWWPLSYRLSYDAAAGVPGLNARLFLGGQMAFLGLLAAIVGWLAGRRRALFLAAGGVALVVGLWTALPPLAVDAYPTTYLRSPIAYQASSIAKGQALYAAHCATCHGKSGRGDGPGGAGLPRPPADLTAPHTGQHTAGDLFWWISHGIPAAGMPPFAGALAEDDRWDLINFLRALAAGEQARALTPLVERERPWMVAPDFSFSVGPAPPRALRDARGQFVTLLVLFSLPDSLPRLDRLARSYGDVGLSEAELVAVPTDADPHILRRLGANPPIFFPVATDGAADIVSAYSLFSRSPGATASPPRHVEFLIDRQGYIRARWLPGESGKGWDDLEVLGGQIRALEREAPVVPAPDEHVH
ncbi:MAG TPA: CopD family protein [Candidatus Methylomirabilis sp.]|nr:CopD family protein [Candidatus Methylomirabilis sp.]